MNSNEQVEHHKCERYALIGLLTVITTFCYFCA